MAELWATFHDAWEVLAFCALGALLAVEAEAGAAACRALGALLAVEAEAGAAARSASVALFAMLAESGAAARPASLAVFAMLTESGASARPASPALLAVRALLVDAPPDCVRRRGGRAELPGLLGLPAPWREMAATGSEFG